MKIITSLSIAGLALAGSMAFADDSVPLNEGWRVGVGGSYVHVNSKTDDFTGSFTPPGLSLNIKSTSAVVFSLSKALTSHVDMQLLGGVPPTHDVVGKGSAKAGSLPYDGVKVGTAKAVAPTFMVNYNFREPRETWRPYLGFGINYTHFTDTRTTATGDAINGGTTKVSMSDSLGLAAQIGIRANLTSALSLNASLIRPYVHSQLTTTTDGIARTTSINFNPLVTTVTAEYSY